MPSAPPAFGGGAVVLVSDHVDGRSRSAVAAVRALGAAGYRPVVTVVGRPSAAAASRSCAGILRTPPVDQPGFRATVENFRAAHAAEVLPASDAVLVALDGAGAELVDKAALPKRAAEAGLEVPASSVFPDAAAVLAAANDLDYPVVVKAAVKTRPTELARVVPAPRDLPAVLEPISGPVVVQPFARGPLRAVGGVIHDGRLLAMVHQRYLRIWPPDCGTSTAAVTTDPDLDLEERLPVVLAGHTGVFQVQLVGDLVIDVNPRAYGSLPLAVMAGANLPAIAVRAAAGEVPSATVRARPGVRYRWLEGDLRRVLHDVHAGTMRPGAAARALLPHRRTAHSVESLRDPGPMLVRLTDVARRGLA
jgi:hypothetical protein